MKPIHVFYRTCYHSPNQDLPNRSRPEWFSKEKCFKNFKETINLELADYTVIYDARLDPRNTITIPLYMFIKEGTGLIISAGTEAESFLETLNIALNTCKQGQIVYFLEDDYIHTPGWCEKLLDGFELGADYISGLDHRDKYKDYPDLKSKLYVSQTCHWRTTPSTTNTFAVPYQTLVEDAELHRKYSENPEITQDWAKFEDLQNRGRVLLTPIPGFSTHCNPNDMSPAVDWERIQKNSLCEHEWAEHYGDRICINCLKRD